MIASTHETLLIHPIRNEVDYERACGRIYTLMQKNIVVGSAEGDELDILATLVEAYEAKHYPIPPPHSTPIEAIIFMAEQKAMPDVEFTKLLGGRSRKSEIMSGKRKLSLAMIRRLSAALGISADVLVQEY